MSSRKRSRKAPAALPAPDSNALVIYRNAVIVVATVIVLVGFIRLRVMDVPLERDEGEYAYAGQLILDGVPPYQLEYNMKFPGTYYAYAAIESVFGETPRGIHAGLLLVNVATIVLVFLLGRRLMGDVGAATAAVLFAFLSLDRFVMGVFAHASHFVLLPALAGLLLALRSFESRRDRWLFPAGVF